MSKFAKLFETAEGHQICVLLGKDDEGAPEVRFYAQPAGLGVCSFAMGFDDSDEGFVHAEQALEKVDLAMAQRAMETIFNAAADITA
jgi:hypothetical protein